MPHSSPPLPLPPLPSFARLPDRQLWLPLAELPPPADAGPWVIERWVDAVTAAGRVPRSG